MALRTQWTYDGRGEGLIDREWRGVVGKWMGRMKIAIAFEQELESTYRVAPRFDHVV